MQNMHDSVLALVIQTHVSRSFLVEHANHGTRDKHTTQQP